MTEVNLPYNFDFRPYQTPQFTASCEGINRFYKVWHRRAGKDITDINFTIMKMMERVGNYWHMLPEYKQARKAIWRGKTADGRSYIDHFPPELIKKKRDHEMEIELINGSIWQIVGSDNVDAVRGAGPVGVTFSEFAFTHPNAWPTVEPILLENGGWAVFNTTPFGTNHAKELWDLAEKNPKWFTQLLTIKDTCRADGNPIITEEMIEELRAMGTSEETIQREYYCGWEGSIEGAYYAQILSKMDDDGLLTSVPYNPSFPVFVYMDIGKSDYTSIWFGQKVGLEYRFIDYYQASNEDPVDHARLLKDKGYNYSDIYLPHDAEQKRYGMSKTVTKQFRDLMPKERVHALKVPGSIQADIFSVKSFLPRCVFDKAKCKDGLDALYSYAKKWSDVKNCFDDKPHHNWASHGADAFRYAALDLMNEYQIQRPQMDDRGMPTFEGMMAGQGHKSKRI